MTNRALTGVLVAFLGVILVCVPGVAAEKNELPGKSDIERAVVETLPAFWGLASISVTEPVDYGNPVEPDWRWRYEAVITPREPLFFEGGTVEEVVLLQPSLDLESQETVYGIARATFHAGIWNLEIAHDNRPFESRGLPASFFSGRVVILGSPEEQAELEEVRERNLKTLQARHEARIAAVKVEQQTALAEAEETARTELAIAQADHEAMLASLKQQTDEGIAEIQETVRKIVLAAGEEHDAKLEALKIEKGTADERHKAQLAAVRADLETELAALENRARKRVGRGSRSA